jgi:hypothetical protein
MALKIEDILTYLETRLVAQIPSLSGKVKVTKEDEPYPGVIKDYGVQIYLGENPKEIVAKKIGNVIHEIWHVNVDFLFNRNVPTSRHLYSDSRGLSYWENLITSTLLHQTNSGAFVNSWWEFVRQENLADAVKLKGIHHTELINRY